MRTLRSRCQILQIHQNIYKYIEKTKILQGHFQSQLVFYFSFSNLVSCKREIHRFTDSTENRVAHGQFGKLGVGVGHRERQEIRKMESYVNDSRRAFNTKSGRRFQWCQCVERLSLTDTSRWQFLVVHKKRF